MPPEVQLPPTTPPAPEKTEEPAPHKSLLGGKGLIIAAIIVIIALIIGASALIGLGSTDQYQGYIYDLEARIEEGQSDEKVIETQPLPTELEIIESKINEIKSKETKITR